MIISPSTHLLKLAAVAEELSVGERTVQEWVYGKQPVLASVTVDKVRRVSLADLTQFVLEHTVRPHRPDWLTPAVENDFRLLMRQEVQAAWLELQRKAA